jgi:hypothetical protein
MATRKAAGSAKNLTDSKPKYLGTKLYAGEMLPQAQLSFASVAQRSLQEKTLVLERITHSLLLRRKGEFL